MSVTRERTRGKLSSFYRYRLMYLLRSITAAWRRSYGDVMFALRMKKFGETSNRVGQTFQAGV
jgi:hypothetical protein